MCRYMYREEQCMKFLSLDILYLRCSVCLPTWKISVQSKAKPCELPWPVVKTLFLSNYALFVEQHVFKPSIACHHDWNPWVRHWQSQGISVKCFILKYNIKVWLLKLFFTACFLRKKFNFVYCSNDAEWIRRCSTLQPWALHHMSFITIAF